MLAGIWRGGRVLWSPPMVPLDTAPEAALLQERAYQEMGIAGRLRVAFELSDLTHTFAIAGIRRRNPQFTEEEARRRLAELLYQG